MTQEGASGRAYFSSPQEAVPAIAALLRQGNFAALAQYYDLTNSSTRLAELESGDFFVRQKRPEVAHPAGFWRYRHPFAPGFEYSGIQASGRENVHLVRVGISIEQGAGLPVQEGFSYFYMIQAEQGWQVLPDQVEGNDASSALDP